MIIAGFCTRLDYSLSPYNQSRVEIVIIPFKLIVDPKLYNFYYFHRGSDSREEVSGRDQTIRVAIHSGG